ncbi:transmembrane protein 121B-like [Actinia tenebrosa]|uniref:Transmembrane protein 121B-like n=1 Tax=Actinia tenebrosa TaxID=6105 RepID=A0A6P8HHN4_ACTTE|nr:transmembrane protein 121B-like [Actinia tenebrosa]
MGKNTAIWRRHVARILGVLLLVFQGAIIDYYLIQGESSRWFAWLLTDGVVLATWIAAMLISYRRLSSRKQRYSLDQGVGFFNDELAFAYIAWLVYALHLVPQVATLFRTKASKLDEKTMVFGPNMLKMCLCITPALFLFLLFAHHDSKPRTSRKFYLEKLSGAVTLDLFDSVEMLEYLFEKDAVPDSVNIAILIFSCINFFLPVFALYELKHNKFHANGQVSPLSFKIFYICSFLFFVNVPFLVIRLILWHSYHLDISVLLAKNALAIVLGVIEIAEFCGDERPKKCLSCSNTFAKSSFKSHLEVCANEATGELELMRVNEQSPSNDGPTITVKTGDPNLA